MKIENKMSEARNHEKKSGETYSSNPGDEKHSETWVVSDSNCIKISRCVCVCVCVSVCAITQTHLV